MRTAITSILIIVLSATLMTAQSGGHTLWGDIRIAESSTSGARNVSFQVFLYSESGQLQMRQTVQGNGRYRFIDLRNGRYQVVVEYEGVEIGRISVTVNSPFKNDFREDIELQWNDPSVTTKASVVSVAEHYPRSSAAMALFNKASEESEKKRYDQAIAHFQSIVKTDAADFPAWQRLGTIHFILKDFEQAEACYVKALQLKPDYLSVLISLGRLRIARKHYNEAIEVLDRAVKLQPSSSQANYFLGEAYLQIKLGSKAVPYLNEAIRLDPVQMADAHLRLAALYNARDMKDKAAYEYSEFLKVKPQYPDRKKLEEYISTFKKAPK